MRRTGVLVLLLGGCFDEPGPVYDDGTVVDAGDDDGTSSESGASSESGSSSGSSTTGTGWTPEDGSPAPTPEDCEAFCSTHCVAIFAGAYFACSCSENEAWVCADNWSCVVADGEFTGHCMPN